MKDQFLFAGLILIWILFISRHLINYYFWKKAHYEALLVLEIDKETKKELENGKEK